MTRIPRAETPRSPRPRDAHAGFTLVEVMLALILSSVVVLACYGLFTVMDNARHAANQQAAALADMSLAHRTIEQALSTLLMTDRSPPRTSAEDQNQIFPPPEGERARLILTSLEASSLMQSEDGSAASAQVLELALSAPPIQLMRDQQILDPRRGALSRQQARRHRENRDQSSESSDDDRSDDDRADDDEDDLSDEPIAAPNPGVRGVFELTWQPDYREPTGGSWALWWRQLLPEAPSEQFEAWRALATAEAVAGERLGSVVVDGRAIDTDTRIFPDRALLVRGVRYCQWNVFRDREFHPDAEATYQANLPAYITLRLETVAGQWADWMFEVAWSTGPTPGEVPQTSAVQRANDENAADTDDDQPDAGPGRRGDRRPTPTSGRRNGQPAGRAPRRGSSATRRGGTTP